MQSERSVCAGRCARARDEHHRQRVVGATPARVVRARRGRDLLQVLPVTVTSEPSQVRLPAVNHGLVPTLAGEPLYIAKQLLLRGAIASP